MTVHARIIKHLCETGYVSGKMIRRVRQKGDYRCSRFMLYVSRFTRRRNKRIVPDWLYQDFLRDLADYTDHFRPDAFLVLPEKRTVRVVEVEDNHPVGDDLAYSYWRVQECLADIGWLFELCVVDCRDDRMRRLDLDYMVLLRGAHDR